MKSLFKSRNFLILWIILFSLLLKGIGQAEENSDSKKRFGVKFIGGMSYLLLGDMKKYQKGKTDFYNKWANQEGNYMDGEYKKMDWGLDIEADMIMYLTSRFGLSVGTGRIYGKNENKLTATDYTGPSVLSFNNRVSAVPIRIGAFYFLPLFSKAKICFQAGAGLYFTKWSRDTYRQDTTEPLYWFSIEEKARGKGFGFHGGIGFEYNVTSRIAIIIEGCGRHAKIRELKGEGEWKDSMGYEYIIEKDKGTLYYYEIIGGIGWVPHLDISDLEPVTPSTRNVKEAVVDFSGFSIRAGIKIALF